MSLNDVLDGIEEEDEEFADVSTVVLEPPEVRVETDEDSGDEESTDLARLTGPQLAAPAEVIGRDAVDEPVPTKRTWSFKKGASMSGLPIFPEGDYSSYTGMMPHEFFELFFTSRGGTSQNFRGSRVLAEPTRFRQGSVSTKTTLNMRFSSDFSHFILVVDALKKNKIK